MKGNDRKHKKENGMKTLNYFVGLLCCGFMLTSLGCTAAVVGGGAAGGYAVSTDERSAGTMLDDAAITTKVKTALIGDSSIKARNIDVDTVAGEVILSGYVDSQQEADKAGSIAKSVAGVARVKNELKVGTRTIGQGVDDKVLGTKIKAQLMKEPGIRSLNIDVDVYSGTAKISGAVASQAQKNEILNLVRSVEGVQGVVDNLQIH
jgi:hyperosmotically inducible periplasmic protein